MKYIVLALLLTGCAGTGVTSSNIQFIEKDGTVKHYSAGRWVTPVIAQNIPKFRKIAGSCKAY